MTFEGFFVEEIVMYQQKIDKELSELLLEKKLKIAVAESLTSGLIAHHLTRVPGSSKYFIGGVVCYNTIVKIKLCGVLPKTIQKYGEVSEQVALEMVRGIKSLTNCDIAVSTTGIAGPENDQYTKDQTGLVFIGLSYPDRESVKKFKFTGSRDQIQKDATEASLGMVREYLKVNNSITI